jgi:hypothetical protein
MKAMLNGKVYDTSSAREVATDPSRDGDDALYQTKDGGFFIVETVTYLDGKKLEPWQAVEDMDPELSPELGLTRPDAAPLEKRWRGRVKMRPQIHPLSQRDAMLWCIKTQIPECFRGYLLEAI